MSISINIHLHVEFNFRFVVSVIRYINNNIQLFIVALSLFVTLIANLIMIALLLQ